MTPELFHTLGYYRPDEVVIFGFPSLTRLGQALTANGLVQPTIRIVRSWDPPNPDSTLSTANEKLKLGEFSYTGSGNSITQDAAWRSANIFRYAIPVGGGTINTYCHRLVEPGIQAALAEVTARGLGGLIDRANTNSAGGCYGAREVRANGSTTGGSISRHSWGGAIDMNTVTNCLGCVPHMNCTIVQIFRKYGFAWGGNFLDPDGMHFEYVGERRDLLSYPSRYCPNVAGVTRTPSPNAPERAAVPPNPTATDSRDQLFVRPEEDESVNG